MLFSSGVRALRATGEVDGSSPSHHQKIDAEKLESNEKSASSLAGIGS